ncbi:MAG: hypothetical protein QNJ30_05050 [Kiloniellales bacterium]|nr:hypothetical protein [Kiloniellales bacterium]
MTLAISKAHPGIGYDPSYFDPSDIARLAGGLPAFTEAPETAAPAAAPPAGAGEAVTEADVDRAIAEIREEIEAGSFEPEVFAGQDLDALADKARTDLTRTMVRGEMDDKVRTWLEAALARVQLVQHGQVVRLEVDGEAILTADLETAEGRAAFPYFELAMVALDVVFVIAALAGVAFAIDGDLKKAVRQIVTKAKDGFLGFVNRVLDKIRPYLPEFRSAGSKLGELVKTYIKAIADGVWAAAKFGWNHLWTPIKAIFKAIFSSGWAVASALFSLAGFLVGLIGTAGAALAAALLNLVSALCQLVADCIKLAEAMGEKQAAA